MVTTSFHPQANEPKADKLAEQLRSVARFLLILAGGFLPLIFVPSPYLPFSAGKTMIVAGAFAAAMLFFILAMLREGKMTLRVPLTLVGIWAVAAATFVSAVILGNDVRDAIFGDALEGYTAGFTLLLAVVATAAFIFAESRQAVIRLYGVLILSSIILTVFHVARLIFGPETLSFGIFTSATSSPLGSWNGLAIFYNLVILIVLIALQRLPLSLAGRWISAAVTLLSLFMLAVVNFFASWWLLAIVSGIVVLHQMISKVWRQPEKGRRAGGDESFALVLVSILVLITAIVFLIGGDKIGATLSERLGVGFVEVRPSATATVDITRAVYADDAIFGSGPNRFADVWRIHRDPAINQTIFWNAQFDSGYSYVTTSFVNTGLLGAAAWIVFFIGLVWAGARFLFKVMNADRFWYFIGLSSLAASAYFWVMSIVYVPPASILLLAAFTTGIFLATYVKLMPGRALTISAASHRVQGLTLVVVAVAALSSLGYGLYAAGTQIAGIYQFNKILATAAPEENIEDIDNRIVSVFDLSGNDAFARQIAFHQWSQMRSILTIENPGDTERQNFEKAAARGIEAAQLSVDLDPTDPLNHQILGQIYSVLSVVGIDGAKERAADAFATAKKYDPSNPTLLLLEADLALQQQDAAGAREKAEAAARLKPNYTEALFFLAQMDINDGNVDRAIEIVAGVAQLEPQNPARRYQLGILLSGAGRLNDAVAAFEQAVALDPQYANARYFLALGYVEQGKVPEAIEQLKVVRGLNESNAVVDGMIAELEETGTLAGALTESAPVTERDSAGGGVTEGDVDNDLVTSSNPVPPAAEEAAEAEATSTAAE